MGLAEDLATLGDLFERGVIDRHHFEAAKSRLLGDSGEVSAEGVASEDKGSLLPTADRPRGAEAPSEPPPPSSRDKHPKCAEEDEPESFTDEEPEEVGRPGSQSLREQVKENARVLSLGVLAIVVSIVGLSIYGEFFAPPTEAELRRELASHELDFDSAGYRYPSDRYAERRFINWMRSASKDQDLRYGHLSGEHLVAWGYEACDFLDAQQPEGVIHLTSIYRDLDYQGYFQDRAHADEFIMVVAMASQSLCFEYAYIYDHDETREVFVGLPGMSH